MITAAPPSGPRWELADWLELESTCAPDGAASVFSVNSDSLIDPDEEPDEVDEVDRERDERIARLITEVEQRRAALGDAYPFSVSADGAFFHRALTLDVGALVYMFCLLASHGRAGGLLHEADIVLMNDRAELQRPVISRRIREMVDETAARRKKLERDLIRRTECETDSDSSESSE